MSRSHGQADGSPCTENSERDGHAPSARSLLAVLERRMNPCAGSQLCRRRSAPHSVMHRARKRKRASRGARSHLREAGPARQDCRAAVPRYRRPSATQALHCFGECRGQLGGVGAARLRHVGAPAALAAHLLGDEVHQLSPALTLPVRSAVTPAISVTLPSLTVPPARWPRSSAILQLVHGLAQRLRVGAVDRRGEHLGALHVHGCEAMSGPARSRASCAGAPVPFPGPCGPRAPAAAFCAARRRLLGRSPRRTAFVLDRLHPAQRAFAGGRLDAPDAGGHAALLQHLEQADVAGARDVRAAAEFARSADVQHAHFIPYFSPNSITAPDFFASSIGMTCARVCVFFRISAFTSRSTLRISSPLIGLSWAKSNRVLSGSTSEPFCCTCAPSTSRSALCMRCVAEWLRMVLSRRATSTRASTLSPTLRAPGFSVPWCPNTSDWIFCVSSTVKVPAVPTSSPRSPTWPPDSA